MHSKYEAFSAEVCGVGHTQYVILLYLLALQAWKRPKCEPEKFFTSKVSEKFFKYHCPLAALSTMEDNPAAWKICDKKSQL